MKICWFAFLQYRIFQLQVWKNTRFNYKNYNSNNKTYQTPHSKKRNWKQNKKLIWIILEPAFVICDYDFFFLQFDILHGQHKNEMEEVSGLTREESKSPNSSDRVAYELRAEVRFWIKGSVLKHIWRLLNDMLS